MMKMSSNLNIDKIDKIFHLACMASPILSKTPD